MWMAQATVVNVKLRKLSKPFSRSTDSQIASVAAINGYGGLQRSVVQFVCGLHGAAKQCSGQRL